MVTKDLQRKPHIYRIVVFLLLSACGLTAEAQCDAPFAVEGKHWETTDFERNYIYEIRGDTIIGGIAYKQALRQSEAAYGDTLFHYYRAVRDEGKLVYVVLPGTTSEEILFDFGLEFREQYRCGDGCHGECIGVWTGYWHSIMHRLLWVTVVAEGQTHVPSSGYYWLEGIGSEGGPFDRRPTSEELQRCILDGETLFERGDNSHDGYTEIMMSYYSGMGTATSAHSNEGGSHRLYDLQGRRLPQSKWSDRRMPKGVYIQNGRKVVR